MREIVRVLDDVENLWDKEQVFEYFENLGRKLGFRSIRNYSNGRIKIPCAWVEGGVFAAFDAEFGNTKEIAGSIALMDVFNPYVRVLVVKDVKKASDVLKGIPRGKTVLIGVEERKWGII